MAFKKEADKDTKKELASDKKKGMTEKKEDKGGFTPFKKGK